MGVDHNVINLIIIIRKYRLQALIFLSSTYFLNLLDNIFDPINNYLLINSMGLFYVIYDSILLILNIKIPTYSLFISVFIIWLLNKSYRLFKFEASKLKIISAVYGKNNKYMDIKNNLNDLVENNTLRILLDNRIAGDPIYGTPKEGIIKYKYNGNLQEKNFNEGDLIELP